MVWSFYSSFYPVLVWGFGSFGCLDSVAPSLHGFYTGIERILGLPGGWRGAYVSGSICPRTCGRSTNEVHDCEMG